MRWAIIPDTDGRYRASKRGVIQLLTNWPSNRGPVRWRTVQPRRGSVLLKMLGKQRNRTVAFLVLLAFRGRPPKPDLVAFYLDGNPCHWQISNLRWGTKEEQTRQRYARAKPGIVASVRTLTDEQVREVRRLRAENCSSLQEIGDRFGVNECTVRDVVARRFHTEVK